MTQFDAVVIFRVTKVFCSASKSKCESMSINYPIMKQDIYACNDLHNYNLLDISFFNLTQSKNKFMQTLRSDSLPQC